MHNMSLIMTMVTCPKCKKEVIKSNKMWKYSRYTAMQYFCSDCGKKFIVYLSEGKPGFTLALEKGKGWQKVC